MNILELEKYREAKTRAKDRAARTMRAIERDPTYVDIPPEIDPFNGKWEEAMAQVFFENELARLAESN